MRVIFLLLVLALTLLNLFMFQKWVGQEPEVITRTKYVQVPPVIIEVPYKVVVEKEVIVEKVVAREKLVEVIVEVPKDIKPFPSLMEFAQWVAQHRIEDAEPDQCVDTALRLVRLARADGYELSTELWNDGRAEGHMIVSTVIGDKIYFAEPTNAFVWWAGVKKNIPLL